MEIDLKIPVSCPNCKRIIQVKRLRKGYALETNVQCPKCPALGFDWEIWVSQKEEKPVYYFRTTVSGVLTEISKFNNAKFYFSNR